MKKLLLVSALFLFVLAHPQNISAGPQCDDLGGSCKTNCSSNEEGRGLQDCTPNPKGPSEKCCVPPPSDCNNLGGDCVRFQYGVCPDGYKPNPIGEFAKLGCSTRERCCIPLTTGCSNWNPVTGCEKDYTRCTNAQTICCANTNNCPIYTPPGNGQDPTCNNGQGIDTAIGCIPITDTNLFIGFILRWAIGIGGGIAFLLIVYSAFMIMTSQGNPERLKAGQELLTSAIAGLIMLIFSVFILELIGVKILQIPGFSESPF